MTEIKEIKKQDDLEQSFHNWRHNDVITQMFFEFVDLQSKILTHRLKNLYLSDLNKQDKLIQLGALSACAQMLDSFKTISYQDVAEWSESKNEKA